MPGLFSRLKGNGRLKSKKGRLGQLADQQPQKPRWEDAWTRKTVEPEEVQQLIRFCTEELKARGMTSNFDFAAPTLHMKWPLSGTVPQRYLTAPCSSRSPLLTSPFPTDLRSQRGPYLRATLF